MRFKTTILGCVAAAAVSFASGASAATVGYVSSPSDNSVQWGNAITTGGGTFQSYNFNDHALGALQSNAIAGATLSAVGDVNTVVAGAGPGQSNRNATPLSTGEGASTQTRYLADNGQVSSLTVDFDTGVAAAGLMIIDYFNPLNNNGLRISAYSGVGGTGTLLGSFDSVAFNFQGNNTYFMGLVSDANDIRSFLFEDLTRETGDTTGIASISYGSIDGGTTPVPLPASVAFLMAGLGAFGLVGRRRTA